MNVGKKNIIFGFGWLIVYMSLGFYLEVTGMDPKWYQPVAKWGVEQTGEMENFEQEAVGIKKMPRILLATAHHHANEFAILNILIGLVLAGAALSERLKKTTSWLAIIGAGIFPTTLALAGFGLVKIVYVTPFGGVAMSAAIVLTFVGKLKE